MNEFRQKLLTERKDLAVIADRIPEGVKILDLGCGDGSLLRLLKDEKNINGLGVEVSQDKIIESVGNGVPVIHADLNAKLPFKDNSFDYVLLSQTLQAVDRPDLLLQEMIRIGDKIIISFINFGFYKARLQLLLRGRMPVTETLPSTWYNTENIHLATILDFRNLCVKQGLRIIREIPVGQSFDLFAKLKPNLFAPTCVFVLQKA